MYEVDSCIKYDANESKLINDEVNKENIESKLYNCKRGGMQLDPHPSNDKVNAPATQTENANF